jgi:Peptidase family M23
MERVAAFRLRLFIAGWRECGNLEVIVILELVKEIAPMTAPNLTIVVQPAESSSVIYGVLAAKTNNDQPTGQLCLVLSITNKEATPIHVSQIVVSFVGPPSVAPSTYAVDLAIAAGGIVPWHFDIHYDSMGNLVSSDYIFLPIPAPGTIKIALTCDGYSDPATISMPLVPYSSPATDGGYIFPAKTGDLRTSEFWAGASGTHAAAGDGSQMFAYDLGVLGFDQSANGWSWGLSSTTPKTNDDFRIWSKPVYAMADGVVVAFKADMPTNTTLGKQVPTPNPVEGNHFYIQHGPDLALYAHFQPNTLSAALINGPNPDGTGAAVKQGDFLALAGNSGNSSGPHLHIEVIRATAPWGGPARPLPFRDISVLDFTIAPPTPWPPNSSSPWNPVSAQDLPQAFSMVWPGNLAINWGQVWRYVGALAWAWIIAVGGSIIFTPGGQFCTSCGSLVNIVLGAVSIGLGIGGFVSLAFTGRVARPLNAPKQLNVRGDM